MAHGIRCRGHLRCFGYLIPVGVGGFSPVGGHTGYVDVVYVGEGRILGAAAGGEGGVC